MRYSPVAGRAEQGGERLRLSRVRGAAPSASKTAAASSQVALRDAERAPARATSRPSARWLSAAW